MGSDELYSTAGSYGIRTLSAPPNAIADIVFVHGLTGNRETTWTDKSSETFWPQTLLTRKLQNAELSTRVITFGYDANVIGLLETAGSNRLRDHGKSLAEDLAMMRLETGTNNRPLIFVVHSMGGLVCEQALLISRDSADSHMNDLLEATYAIAFLGTPHHGSDKANWTKVLRDFSSILRHTNKDLLRVLEPGSEMLANLQQMFHVMLDKRQKEGKRPINIFCFYEELGVLGIGKIVPMHSAILAAYGNRSIHANHMDMTKFPDVNDAGFMAVSGRIWLWANEIKIASTPKVAPAKEERDQPSAADLRKKREQTYSTLGDVPQSEGSQRLCQRFGPVNSRGGAVFQGNENVYATYNSPSR